MAISKIQSAPLLESFTPLAEHQAQTPLSFHGGKPVLHFYDENARLLISKDYCSLLAFPFPWISDDASNQRVVVDKLKIFISTANITLFNVTNSVGVTIPYTSVSLHAIQTIEDPEDQKKEVKGLYMQLENLSLEASNDEDQDLIYPDMTLIPSSNFDSTTSSIQTLFDAVSACSNLYPDPCLDVDEEMEDASAGSSVAFCGTVGYEGMTPNQLLSSHDGIPPAFPGSGGWITAENVNQYFDSEGNWIGGDNGVQSSAENLPLEEVITGNGVDTNKDEGVPADGAGKVRTIGERDADDISDAGPKAEEVKRVRRD